ncbi:hypothetical protein CIPAW_12G002000 [Carya illinoinensis]|uniref:Uncharacterized protein n=1 Tax=Carya illinoinensis TaxID=32201 RepID=A0A8T1NV28_CARIL|nr:hypothetical protein CIPAW_12G002000 [Carya illinoinensis]
MRKKAIAKNQANTSPTSTSSASECEQHFPILPPLNFFRSISLSYHYILLHKTTSQINEKGHLGLVCVELSGCAIHTSNNHSLSDTSLPNVSLSAKLCMVSY